MEAFTFNTIELFLVITAGFLFFIQVLYYTCLYNRIHTHNVAVKQEEVHFTHELPPLSVVICARNESNNLQRSLPLILEQDYPNFEVIVINEGATDESEELLTQLEEKYRNLYHSFIPDSARYISRKKLGLTLGIKASKNDWLVFTEPNCRPESNQWLRLMARNFTPRTQIVLGYSNYECSKGWLQKRISFDSLFTSLAYLGFALAGKPYMGIGRNMAYRKELFFAQKGYSAHLNLQRGEDDLFINKVTKKENTRVETAADSVVRIQPVERYKEWKEERVSYMATANYFKGSQNAILTLETTSRLFFYGCSVAAITIGIVHLHWLAAAIPLLLWIIRWGMQAFIMNRTSTEMGDKRHYYLTLPLFDLLLPMQAVRFNLYRLLRKKEDLMRR